METPGESLKKYSELALCALALLLVGSIVYYKERAHFADGAYFIFNIVNYKKLAIQWGRYGSFITQVLPYWAARLHTPMRFILVIFSAGFNLFYLAVAFIIHGLKQYSIAVLMAVFYFIFYIGLAIPKFAWRTHLQKKILEQMMRRNITKLALIADDTMYDKYLLDWATPYESLVLSAADGDNPQRVFFFVRPGDKQTLQGLTDNTCVYTMWGKVHGNELNKEFFVIDTTNPYQAITYKDLCK